MTAKESVTAAAEEEEEESVPEHLRCNRNDGRKWRCRRRVMENLNRCEIHHLQQRLRHNKQKVPDSLKLQREKKHKINHHHHIAAPDFKNANKFKMVKKKKKNPNLSSDGNNLNANHMEGEGEGEGSGTVDNDITGYDLENRISKLEKLIAKFKVAKLASKAWKIDKQFL